MSAAQNDNHYVDRIGWLRAAVLGANDGIVSTASLITGVATAGIAYGDILLAGTAGLVAGAMSMAAGEYVSVSSQADVEAADLVRERQHLDADPEFEHEELSDIWIERGLEPELAREVSKQLMAHDDLAAHARDELGISHVVKARPIQAALSSAASFTVGAALPLLAVILSPFNLIVLVTTALSLFALALLGALSAYAGGAPITRAVLRVLLWGALAMAATAYVGHLFGTAVT
jgi:VIT1/CCC1 family predicted Fe2+/Mn2+ transporter